MNTKMFFIFFRIVMYITIYYQITKQCRAGTWINPLVVDRIEVDMNVSLQLIGRKKRGLNRLHDWRKSAYITRRKSVVSPEIKNVIFN